MAKGSLKITWIAAILGLIDAGYLSYIKLFQAPIFCTPGLGDCSSVNASKWSYLFGIPVAYLGLLAYIAVIALLAFGNRWDWLRPYSNYLLFAISAFGFLFSLYLTYLEIWVIKAICQWCMVSAILMTVIFISACIRVSSRHEIQYS